MSLQDNVRRFESWRKMVEDVETAVTNDDMDLDDWSVDLLESVKRRLAEMSPLTERQDEALTKLWGRSLQ